MEYVKREADDIVRDGALEIAAAKVELTRRRPDLTGGEPGSVAQQQAVALQLRQLARVPSGVAG